MNRRGDIPVTILVLGVLIICGLALLSFFSAGNHGRESFGGLGLVEEINSQVEEALFDGENPEGLKLEKKSGKRFLLFGKQKLLFSVEYEPSP